MLAIKKKERERDTKESAHFHKKNKKNVTWLV